MMVGCEVFGHPVNHEALHHIIFSSLLFIPSSQFQVFPSALHQCTFSLQCEGPGCFFSNSVSN